MNSIIAYIVASAYGVFTIASILIIIFLIFRRIKLKEKEYLCISNEGIQDIEINDKIGLIENDEIKDIVKIIHKTDNFLLCDKKDTSFDSIINLSLQNTLYCDIS